MSKWLSPQSSHHTYSFTFDIFALFFSRTPLELLSEFVNTCSYLLAYSHIPLGKRNIFVWQSSSIRYRTDFEQYSFLSFFISENNRILEMPLKTKFYVCLKEMAQNNLGKYWFRARRSVNSGTHTAYLNERRIDSVHKC